MVGYRRTPRISGATVGGGHLTNGKTVPVTTARPLTIWDAAFCWRLTCEPDVRAASHRTEQPTLRGHLRWMLRWLLHANHRAWLLRSDYRACGISHVERIQDGRRVRAVIGIAVLPRCRHGGVGECGVRIATRWAEDHGWGVPTAFVKVDNMASLHLFSRAGYNIVGVLANGIVHMAMPANEERPRCA